LNKKLESAAINEERFQEFLAKRREKKNTPERKKFRQADHLLPSDIPPQPDDMILSENLEKLYKLDDYILEEEDLPKKLN